MRVTYPHMGYLTIPMFTMMESLGIDVVEASAITKKTVELGSLYSPKNVCLPYKITLGNFLGSMERGADTFVTICGGGKCRMDFQKVIRESKPADKASNHFYTINIDNLYSDLYNFLREVVPKAGRLTIIQNIACTVKKLKALDALNNAKNFYGARAESPDRIIEIYSRGSRQLADCKGLKEIEYAQRVIVSMMEAATNSPSKKVPRVALIGEYYVLLEPYISYGIEDALLKQGIEAKKFIYQDELSYVKMIINTLGFCQDTKGCHSGRPKSIGNALWCAKNGYDGIIHIYPFRCTTEGAAQNGLKNVASAYNIPLLSIVLDEHSDSTGVNTKIQEFTDCFQQK